MRFPWGIVLSVIVQALGGISPLYDHAFAQEQPTEIDSKALIPQRLLDSRRSYEGVVTNCVSCHTPDAVIDPVLSPPDDKWVRNDEVVIWNANDKHRQAYSVLSSPLGETIGKTLNTDATRDKRCLACHCSVPHYELGKHLSDDGSGQLIAAASASEPSFRQKLRVGVSCEGCHGPAGDRDGAKGWLDEHKKGPRNRDDVDAWRFKDPIIKESEFGYWNVRSPFVARADLCVLPYW